MTFPSRDDGPLGRNWSPAVPGNIYSTDVYTREACVASVEVLANGYRLEVRDPSGRVIEGYAPVKSPAAISRMLREWCEGKRPMLKGEGD